MHHVARTCVLVADSRQANLFALRHNEISHKLELEAIYPAPLKAIKPEREMGRRILPRIFQSMGTFRHAQEPSIDIKQETRRRFMHDVAAKLSHAYLNKTFERLILVAPAKVMGELHEALPENLQETVIAEVRKQLTHCHPKGLALYLSALV